MIVPVPGYMWYYKGIIAGVMFNNCVLCQFSALWYMQRVAFIILHMVKNSSINMKLAHIKTIIGLV